MTHSKKTDQSTEFGLPPKTPNESKGESGGESEGESSRKFDRYHTRIKIPYWKFIHFRSQGEVFSGFVKNISKGGFFIETDSIYEKGEEIGFEFFVPNNKEAIKGKAIVRWVCFPDDEDKDISIPPGMGLEFATFEDEGEIILDEFLRLVLQKSKEKV